MGKEYAEMKYQRTQIVVKHPVTGRDILFDSIMEANYFQELLRMEADGKITHIECHPEYVLQEPFTYFGKKVNGVVYTPDFTYYDLRKRRMVAIEVKGIPTPDFELRLKWWKHQNQDTEIFVMAWSKSTGWREIHEYKEMRRQIKKETFEARVKKQLEIEKEKKEKRLERLVKWVSALESKPRLNESQKAKLEAYKHEIEEIRDAQR